MSPSPSVSALVFCPFLFFSLLFLWSADSDPFCRHLCYRYRYQGIELKEGCIGIIHLGRALCGHDGVIHGGLISTVFDESLARNVSLQNPDPPLHHNPAEGADVSVL